LNWLCGRGSLPPPPRFHRFSVPAGVCFPFPLLPLCPRRLVSVPRASCAAAARAELPFFSPSVDDPLPPPSSLPPGFPPVGSSGRLGWNPKSKVAGGPPGTSCSPAAPGCGLPPLVGGFSPSSGFGLVGFSVVSSPFRRSTSSGSWRGADSPLPLPSIGDDPG